MWTLKRLIVCFNDSDKKTHDFRFESGVESIGLFNTIEVTFNVADMSIMYFSALQKVFHLEIHYTTECDAGNRNLISL